MPDEISEWKFLILRLKERGQLDNAIALCNEKIAECPTNALYHFDLAVCLTQKGDQDEAIREYLETIKLSPAWPLARFNLALHLLAKRKWEDALFHLDMTVRADPDFGSAHRERGRALRHVGNDPGAIDAFETAIRVGCDDAYVDLADLYSQRGRLKDAKGVLTKLADATDKDHPYPWGLLRLAAAFARAGQVAESREQLAKLLSEVKAIPLGERSTFIQMLAERAEALLAQLG